MKQVCTRCLYDTSIPNITFDEQGVCSYCHMHDSLLTTYPGGEQGRTILQAIARRIKEAGKGKKFDCVVGVSGGCDSSYLLYVAKELMGLRPLAVHFDNTWNTELSTHNMHNMVEKLNVPLEVYTVDPDEYDDLYMSFFKAGVPDIETPTDIALAAVLNRVADKHGIRYILEGHNFRTEGISPLGWIYMDNRYIESVHAKFGTRPLATFPGMPLHLQLYWMMRRIRKIRPLWYMDYNKEDIKKFLADTFGWQWYGGHHLENKFTAFYHSYFMPRRYGIDTRLLGLSAMVRSGKITREQGLKELEKPFYLENGLLEYLTRRLKLDDETLDYYMNLPHKTYRDFPTYKKVFEYMRPFFWLMAKMDMIPYSFYLKYTRPDPPAADTAQ